MLDQFDKLSRGYLGMRVFSAVAFVAALGVGCAMFGWLYPKYDATAMLHFPEDRRVTPSGDDRSEKSNVIDLPEYKRVASSYDSKAKLAAYLNTTNYHESAAALRLLETWENSSSWTVVPVLAISRRDQKDFGELKDAGSGALLGVELKASAGTRPMAEAMVYILAGYFTESILRERIRSWVLAEKVHALSTAKTTQASILRAELEIDLDTRRAEEMKAIIARYPAAAQMDTRQLVTLNAAEGGERFLSPLAQLVGAESSISFRREQIRRRERALRQGHLLAQFYMAAEPLVDQYPNASNLLDALTELTRKTLPKEDTSEEWAREATLLVRGALDGFAAMRSQFGIRRDVRIEAARSRNPLRLAMFGTVLGVVLLGGVALLRAGARAPGASA